MNTQTTKATITLPANMAVHPYYQNVMFKDIDGNPLMAVRRDGFAMHEGDQWALINLIDKDGKLVLERDLTMRHFKLGLNKSTYFTMDHTPKAKGGTDTTTKVWKCAIIIAEVKAQGGSRKQAIDRMVKELGMNAQGGASTYYYNLTGAGGCWNGTYEKAVLEVTSRTSISQEIKEEVKAERKSRAKTTQAD
ncbi:hypothetical protein E6Q11_00175 [Candidatus Dojkabacteria bacterium]|uniref:Uncharacterized protein n=1 Tax=Candidatus Dojkabacteria bacterium TaxID=2099670 RepID=A0A5C7JBA8_9BACT|nr:MAG: hypothetical protein E6Q11_00175 [Candidatus Dojkabacteria bacterium]